jgi:Cobalamin-5-phosphate synthase
VVFCYAVLELVFVLDSLFFKGARAIFLPLFGAAIAAIGVTLVPHYGLIALLWTAAAMLPRERPSLNVTTLTIVIASGLLRWLALESFGGQNIFAAFLAMQVAPRAAMLALAWVSRPGDVGRGYEFSATLTTPLVLIAIAEGVAAAFFCGFRTGLAILAGAYLMLRGIRWFSYRQLGGVNADSFGAAQLLVELFVLLMFTCAACHW